METKIFYLSFASEEGWLGACIVEEGTALAAIARTHLLGINPGGQIEIFEVTGELIADFPPSVRNRLINTREELENLFGPAESVWL